MAPNPKKEILDPEAEMRRKFLLRCRFRAIVRLVQVNAHWMLGASSSEQYLGDDVKRRVAQAIRGKAIKKQLLELQDKALLNKPAADRTEKEKHYLYRIIGGLKCFKRYPAHVKRKLAAATYFRYYGPGRVVVRQHHDAEAMYFVVEGELAVSHSFADELTGEAVSVEIARLVSGDMFGEVSLLHSIPRTATITTLSVEQSYVGLFRGEVGSVEIARLLSGDMFGDVSLLHSIPRTATIATVGHCELLALMKHDFKNILLASVQKQWDEVKKAMDAFTYFDALDEVARREGCIMAKMRSYAAHETILGDGVGVPNFVYFVLAGRCQMIESLQITATTRLGRTHYRLHETRIEDEESESLDFESKYFGALKKKTSSELSQARIVTCTAESKEDSLRQSVQDLSDLNASFTETPKIGVQEGSTIEGDKDPSQMTSNSEEGLMILPSVREASLMTTLDRSTSTMASPANIGNKDTTNRTPGSIKEHSLVSELAPKNLRTYFMQVCQMNPGASFGFGENMRNRRVVALTPVDCMLLPKIWLLQRNTANIWTRIEHFLNRKIPSTRQLFHTFVNERRWLQYREQLVADVVARGNTVNWTTVHDVPYSIRIEEQLDV